MRETTCCVTGHRDIPEERRIWIRAQLENEFLDAVMDGYTRFISGFAQGVDLMFADIAIKIRRERPDITLEAAISHAGRLRSADPEFQRLIRLCDKVTVLSEAYSPAVFERRNRYMVSESGLILAVYDGRARGGTYNTLRYAEKTGIRIREIRP